MLATAPSEDSPSQGDAIIGIDIHAASISLSIRAGNQLSAIGKRKRLCGDVDIASITNATLFHGME